MKNRNNGFTLVELLAVIVILSVIIVIAVPKIMGTVTNSKKASLETATLSIISGAEKLYLENQLLGIKQDIECSDVAKMQSNVYGACDIIFDEEGNATVILNGKKDGKFDNLACSGTKEGVTCKEGVIDSSSICAYNEVGVKYNKVVIPYTVNNATSCISYITEIIDDAGLTNSYGAAISPLCQGNEVSGMTFNDAVLLLMENNLITEEDLIENNVIVSEEKETCMPKLPSNAVTYVNTLYNKEKTNNPMGLIKDNTTDQNIRYSGSSGRVKNYVEFGNAGELWRIIGVFNISNGSTSENRIKLVKVNSIGNYSWDFDGENDGTGLNQWGESGDYEGATLMNELNTLYLNQQSGICCNGTGYGATCGTYSSTVCDFTPNSTSTKGISSTYSNMIDEVIWNTGAINPSGSCINISTGSLSTSCIYNEERGTISGKACTFEGGSASTCTDKVERTPTWKGKIGLIYASDWVYASDVEGCTTNAWLGYDPSDSSSGSLCKNRNWLHNYSMQDAMWTITPIPNNTSASAVFGISVNGSPFAIGSAWPLSVYPSVYLNKDVKIISGDGTISNPYKLSL